MRHQISRAIKEQDLSDHIVFITPASDGTSSSVLTSSHSEASDGSSQRGFCVGRTEARLTQSLIETGWMSDARVSLSSEREVKKHLHHYQSRSDGPQGYGEHPERDWTFWFFSGPSLLGQKSILQLVPVHLLSVSVSLYNPWNYI